MNFFINHAEWITVIGGIIALAGSILVNVKSKQDSAANAKKQAELLKQSIQINQMMTGGDSYPLLTFFDIEHDFGIAQYSISNRGQFPLYVTQIQISDNFEMDKIIQNPNSMTSRGIDGTLLEPYRKTIPLQEIMPKNSLSMNTFPFQFKDSGSFTITFTARNGTFIQQVLTSKIADKWLLAIRLTKFGDTKIIKQYIPPNFPLKDLKW